MAEVHISPVRTYALILVALLGLTGLTVVVAFQDLGILNDVVAIGIAVTKATLVVLFFMHVKYAGRLVKIAIIGSLFCLMVIFGLTLVDYAFRGEIVTDPTPVENTITVEGAAVESGVPATAGVTEAAH